MKMLWFFILCILLQFASISSQSYHRKIMGEYYVEWKALGPCPKEKRGTDEILTDVRITKRNRSIEFVGNVTFKIDFDDTIVTKFNFAILGSNSAWLPNAYSLTFPRSCSDFLNMVGPMWIDFLKSMHMSTKCPLRKGTYEMKGYNLDKLLKTFPKQFIYGHYKITIEFLNKNDALVGCTYFAIDMLPLWQQKKSTAKE